MRAGALGDVLLTLPALHALRTCYPESPIRVIGYPEIWSVAGDMIGEVLSVDSAAVAALYQPSERPPAWLDDTDLFVAWTACPLPGLADAPFPVVHDSPYPPPGTHAARWLMDTLVAADALPSAAAVTMLSGNNSQMAIPDLLHLTDAEREAGRHSLAALGLRQPLLIHPGAGAVWKRWPTERFAALVRWAQAQRREVALIEGPADAPVVAAVQRELAVPAPVVRQTSPRLLAASMAAAGQFVGNDSGVTHLAATAGAETVALFGPTDPVSWAPLWRSTVLRACRRIPSASGQIRVCEDPHCLEAIDLEAVIAALTSGTGNGSRQAI